MENRVLYMQAIRALPPNWISEGTRISVLHENAVVAANPEYPPMIYTDGGWKLIKLD